jgi:hypothetical protein
MARVGAFRIDGLMLWFWSNDHEPPHFNAKRNGEWQAKVNFLRPTESMLEVVWSKKKMQANHRRRLCRLAEQHRFALLQQWEEIQSGQHGH